MHPLNLLFPPSFMEDSRVYLRPPAWLPIVVALVLGGAFILGKQIESRPSMQPTITVQGQGKIQATPDIALLSFGVQTGRQRTAQLAMEMLTKEMNAAIAAVRAAGVEDKDISTQSLRLNPAYDYEEGTRRDAGFEAYQNLVVKVRDIQNITDVLDAAVRAGANQVGSVSFTIDDMEALRADAREKAIADAKEKAKLLAADLGVRLGTLQGYNEGGGGYYPQPIMRMESMAMDAGGGGMAPEIPAGEQEIQVTISLTYEVN